MPIDLPFICIFRVIEQPLELQEEDFGLVQSRLQVDLKLVFRQFSPKPSPFQTDRSRILKPHRTLSGNESEHRDGIEGWQAQRRERSGQSNN